MDRVLLIDDDVELCEMLGEYLETEGFEVARAHDGPAGVQAALGGNVDLVVLDVMLPGMGGLDVLRRIRALSPIPVIMLTAKGDDVDRIVGLEMGADDYLPKPFNPRELVARLRALLRRAGRETPEAAAEIDGGDLRLRPAERVAEWKGRVLDLTSAEFNLLAALARNAGRVVSKAELSELGLGRPLERYDRAIDMHISHLRRKLGALPDGRSPIQTVRGRGYQWIRE